MSGMLTSPTEVALCGCEESMQSRHRNNSLQERLQYLTGVMDENENDLMSFIEQNEGLRQKNDHLVADNQKLRQEVEILKGSHQLQVDIMNNALIYLSEQFRKDEPTKKKQMSDAEVQTEDFGHIKDGCTVCTTVEVIEVLYQKLKDEQVLMKKELTSATQKIAMVTERLAIELKAKQALQTENDRVKADQQEFLLRELHYKQETEELEDLYRKAAEQNEKLRDEMEDQRLFTFGSNGVLDQTFRSLEDSFEEAIAKQNEVGLMIDVQKKQEQARTCRCFKPLLYNTSKNCLRCRVVIFRSIVRASIHSLFSVFQRLF